MARLLSAFLIRLDKKTHIIVLRVYLSKMMMMIIIIIIMILVIIIAK